MVKDSKQTEKAALFQGLKRLRALFFDALAQAYPEPEPHEEEGFVIITAAGGRVGC